MRKFLCAVVIGFVGLLTFGHSAKASGALKSVISPYGSDAIKQNVVVLKNDSFVEGGGQAYLQLGFITGEKAGVWLKVPSEFPFFKVDYFRVLYGSTKRNVSVDAADVFFQMGIATQPNKNIVYDIENAASITAGPYWNDIPAAGESSNLRCARAGEYIGAALEFTHDGSPSVYRDLDGLSNMTLNLLFGNPGGWNYSSQYGLRGDWILRVVGHPANAAECGV